MATPTISSVYIDKDGVAILVWSTSLIGAAPGTASSAGTIPTSGAGNRDGQAYIGWLSGFFQMNGTTALDSTSNAGLFTSFGTAPTLPYADANNGTKIGQPFHMPVVPASVPSTCTFVAPGVVVNNTFDNPDSPNVSQRTTNVTLASGYTGPTTQALVQNNEPKVATVSNNTIRFTTREIRNLGGGAQPFGRQVRRIGVLNTAQLRVNGGTAVTCTAASTTFGDFIDLTFPVTILPGQTLNLILPTAYLEFKHPNYTNTWSSISEDLNAKNTVSTPQPAISSIVASAAGTTLTFTWNQAVAIVDSAAALNFTLSSSLGVVRTKSNPVIAGSTLTVTVSPAIYQGETVQATNTGGQVRYPGSTGSDGLSLAYSNINVPGSTTARPKPVLQTAKIIGPSAGGQNGKKLELTYNLTIVANGSPASITVDGTFPDVNTVFTFSTIEGGTKAIYLTTGQIYAGDICKANVPANIVKETVTNNTNDAVTNQAITNESTVAHPIPVLQTAVVASSGQSIVLTYDINIAAGPNVNALRIHAEDNDTDVSRTMLTINPVISGTTLTLTIVGTVFKDDPPDGDNPVTCDTGSPALVGLVDSALAVSAGQHSYSAALSARVVTNSSDIDEPATAVTPTFANASINTGGDELKIRWTDASGTPIGIRRVSGVPEVSGSTTGDVTPIFARIETDLLDNDTIVFSLNPTIKEQTVDTVTLDVPADLVQSIATNTNNASSGPYTSQSTELTNNSTLISPSLPSLPPVVQDIIVGLDGLKIGIYYDTAISPLLGTVTLDCSLSGRKTAELTGTEGVLGLNLSTDIPVFIGEIVLVTLPYGLVVNITTNLPSLLLVGFEAINNSTIPVPKPPMLDTATISSSGTILTLVFDDDIAASTGFIWIEGSKSGKHLLESPTVTPPSTLQFDIAGIVYIGEEVTVNLAKDVVRDEAYEFTPNDETLKFAVTNNSTQVLPTIAAGLVQETS